MSNMHNVMSLIYSCHFRCPAHSLSITRDGFTSTTYGLSPVLTRSLANASDSCVFALLALLFLDSSLIDTDLEADIFSESSTSVSALSETLGKDCGYVDRQLPRKLGGALHQRHCTFWPRYADHAKVQKMMTGTTRVYHARSADQSPELVYGARAPEDYEEVSHAT
ncbi:hypothetical protein KC19_VG169700 [Ceratodon purpureus]|uniref:Uncharacterized protein n=1 Tax=Ceratodon purpureus TaxID=3225 RepID=A0A8T0HQT4_CERPU|nr:hypothetical protein KC19_VG169700 [Ceratodon purpureus]